MLTTLRLAVVLNAVDAGLLSAPEAEQALTSGTEIHHVLDPDGELGTPEHSAGSLRVALGRVAHADLGQGWAVVNARPGRAAGLRGPKELTKHLTATSADVVVHHRSGLVWEPHELDADGTVAVQWRLRRAVAPLALSLMPDQAGRLLTIALTQAASSLEQLEITAGTAVSDPVTVRLGSAYPPSSQVVLDRALTIWQQIEPALSAAPEVLHSHAVLTREQVLRGLEAATLDAIQAAISWPTHLMQ